MSVMRRAICKKRASECEKIEEEVRERERERKRLGERDEKREGKLHAQREREHYQYRNNMKNSRNLIGQEEGKKARRFEPEEGERRGEEKLVRRER